MGFACNYAGRELYQAIAAFAQQCPQTVVQVVTGTHEELYDLLRFDGVDVKINEQRRAFSQAYENLPLAYRPTVAEVCAHGGLHGRGLPLSLEEARSPAQHPGHLTPAGGARAGLLSHHPWALAPGSSPPPP